MTERDYVYWLMGFFEIAEPKTIDEKQTKLIKQHLDMVFYHSIDKTFPEEEQEVLNALHEGKELIIEDIDKLNESTENWIDSDEGRQTLVEAAKKVEFVKDTIRYTPNNRQIMC